MPSTMLQPICSCGTQPFSICCSAVLGVRLVVVLGARPGIDRSVRAAGGQPRYVNGQRVTDAATMQVRRF